MTIETDIKARLDAHSGLSALVGTRNYPGLFPGGVTYPATAYMFVSNSVTTALDNSYTENPRVQIDVVGTTYSSVRQVVTQVKLAMTSATTFTAVLLSDNDIPPDNSENSYSDDDPRYRAVVDFSIWQQ